jgi:predicted GTPase
VKQISKIRFISTLKLSHQSVSGKHGSNILEAMMTAAMTKTIHYKMHGHLMKMIFLAQVTIKPLHSKFGNSFCTRSVLVFQSSILLLGLF